jgi:formate transporter FocA
MNDGPDPKFDALLPAEMALRAEEVGVRKAALDTGRTFVLAVLAGAFIALGAVFSTTVGAGTGAAPLGWSRAFSGVAFSLGLILVVVGGAELFTGNNLIIMAWASGKVTTLRLLRNWTIVYAGNLAGAVATAILVFVGRQYALGNGAIGALALAIGSAKCELSFAQAIALGVLCNGLVCLAVWLSYSGRTTADKMLAVAPPIAAFVAAGFEHSVANMYFLSVALLIRNYAPDAFWQDIGGHPTDFPELTVNNFVFSNLVPVTLGNIIGGVLLVGATYWFVYLRSSSAAGPRESKK